MPIFEYHCAACGTSFETLQTSSNESNPPCPNCGSMKTNRALSRFSTSSAPSMHACGCGCSSAFRGGCPGAGSCCANGNLPHD